MVRTQVSLEEDAYKAAQREAKRRGISLAAFMREALGLALASAALKRDRDEARGGRPWMRYSGCLASGDPGASESVDEVVYGRDAP